MALKTGIGSIGFCGVYVNPLKNNHTHYMTEGKQKFERFLGGYQFFFFKFISVTNYEREFSEDLHWLFENSFLVCYQTRKTEQTLYQIGDFFFIQKLLLNFADN